MLKLMATILVAIIAMIMFSRRKIGLNLKLFSGAYALHFVVSSVIINHPAIGSLEYAYRTAQPYLIILLAAWICSFIVFLGQRYIRIILILILLAGVLHMLPYAKQNMESIHQEEMISGKYFSNEINFVKSLPQDGRIITYGVFANAVDTGMASLTGHYFSRFHLTEYARSRSIYSKIHSPHSFGQSDELLSMTGIELSNYLRLGGYKYVFVFAGHPV